MASSDGTYRIFGSENSPFSVKVRSYFRYKQLPHEWIVRSEANMAEYQKYAKLPLIPLVVTPEEQAIQDSTPILERMEAASPEPSIHPGEPIAAFVSALLEEFGDEWGNKWMLHYRWAREADQQAASRRLVDEMMPSKSDAERAEMATSLTQRMVGRVWFVGSSEKTAAQIEDSWVQGIDLLEPHLKARPYLFGARPAFADFGLWAQYYDASLDPTPAGILRDRAPATLAWIERMLEPKAEGDFEPWASLEPTLSPYVKAMCGELFLPWSEANARGLADEVEEYDVELAGRVWTQKPVKYQARSLVEIRKKYAAASGDAALDAYLESTGCLRWLKQ